VRSNLRDTRSGSDGAVAKQGQTRPYRFDRLSLLIPLQHFHRPGPPDPEGLSSFFLGNSCQYISGCWIPDRRFGDPMDSPPSPDIPLCPHLTLPPVQAALGTLSTRWRPCPASIPTVCRQTAHSFARNRPIYFAVAQNSEYLSFPFIYPFFSLFTRTHSRGVLTPTI